MFECINSFKMLVLDIEDTNLFLYIIDTSISIYTYISKGFNLYVCLDQGLTWWSLKRVGM